MSAAATKQAVVTTGQRNLFKDAWPVLAVYVFATIVTNAHFMADTADYVDSIVAFAGGRNYDFWEFGHLLFRPFGYLLHLVLIPFTKLIAGDGIRLNVTFLLVALSWVAGLVSVLSLYGIIARFCPSKLLTSLATVAFIFSHGFLNFSQTGSSYIPGLSLLLLGLFILVRWEDDRSKDLSVAFLSGVSFAAAVWMWFPYALALPAAVLSPMILFGVDRKHLRRSVLIATVAGSLILIAYLVVVVGVLGIRSFTGFHKWMTAASHDTDIKGISRMVFGFARSFIYMGNDGMLFKRYLLSDPFNPVTLLDLLRLSLWKLALFYFVLAAMGISLLRSRLGRRVLAFLIISASPVILFAISFDGGAIERYLPLYPAIFLALTVCVWSARSWMIAKAVVFVFIAAVIVTDGIAMARPVLDRRQEAAAARIGDVLQRWKPESRLLTVTWQDELVNFSRSFPFHPLNQTGNVRIGSLVTPGTAHSEFWREGFASQALETWTRGGDIWVSRRVLSQRPHPDWNWAEGDEKRVSWPDFYTFFSQLKLGESVGGEDGFLLVPPSPENREYLDRLLESYRKTKVSFLLMDRDFSRPRNLKVCA